MPELAASLDGPDTPNGSDGSTGGRRPNSGIATADLAADHRPPRPDALLIVGMVAVAAVAYLLRNPTSVLAPSVWAEDGTLFLKDAIERGWAAVLDPYAGQLVVASRATAAALAPLPVAWQPTLYAVASLLMAVLSCGIVLSSRWRDAIPLGARFACLLALVTVPGVGETYGTLANSHWWLGIGLVLLGMLGDPRGRLGRAAELAFAGVVATSGFVALYGIPTLAVRAIRTRSRQSLLLIGTSLLGIAIQVGVLLTSARAGDVAAVGADPVAGVAVLAKRVFATLALGDANLARMWPLDAPSPLAAVAAGLVAVAVFAMWARRPRLEVAALAATIAGGVLLAMWAVSAPGASVSMLFWTGAASRFFLVPKAALIVSALATWSNGRTWRAAAAIASVLLIDGIAADFAVPPVPAVEWAGFARCVDETADDCSVLIPPGWTLELTGRGGP